MDIYIGLLFFIFGTLIGSFLNVVVLRYHGTFSFKDRSCCLSCGHTLRWYELVPIVSFLIQKGKCRKCKSKLSAQYILVEVGTGILFVLAYAAQFTLFDLSFVLATIAILVAILVYDIHHKIVPDALVYLFIGLSFIRLFFDINGLFLPAPLIDFLSGPIIFIPFFAIWYFSKGTWMGLGDGKLALGIAWFLGLSAGFTAIVLSFWIGAAVSLLLLLFQKMAEGSHFFRKHRFSMKSEIPFAPFLILGFLLTLFLDINITTFIL